MHFLNQPLLLLPSIQEYEWGSLTDIPEFLGNTPTGKPQAELWMGAHPKAPSQVLLPSGNTTESSVSLDHLILQYPEKLLGMKAERDFQGQLPFLFKVIAAAESLSIQVHPTLLQAQTGFDTENRLQIPLIAPDRIYRDTNHKPEMIYALTHVWALSGFRPQAEIDLFFSSVSTPLISNLIRQCAHSDAAFDYHECLSRIFNTDVNLREKWIAELVAYAQTGLAGNPYQPWILKLHQKYPRDPGLLVVTLLNLICLKPAEALYTPAGYLHAYLEGMGLEIMANSDNVIRGGFTHKCLDVQELINIVVPNASPPCRVEPQRINSSETIYRAPAIEFMLSIIHLEHGLKYDSIMRNSLEIWLCISGSGVCHCPNANVHLTFKQGTSFLIPANALPCVLEGNASLAKAGVADN